MAQGAAREFEQAGALSVPRLPIELDLPSVGIIALRDVTPTPVSMQLMRNLRQAASRRRTGS